MYDRDLSILVDMSHQLESSARLEDGLHHVTESALRLLGADHASLRICDEVTGELRVAARAGVGAHSQPPSFRVGEGLMGWVARTGRSARVPDCDRDPRFRAARDRGYEVSSLMSFPLRAAGRVWGVLSVSSASRNAFDVRDEQLVRLLCHSASQAVQLHTLRAQSRGDDEIRVDSRALLDQRLEQEMSRAHRSGDALSVMRLDLDHFHQVNDAHGPGVGERVLRGVAEILQRCVRGADVVFRRGDEGFALILPATDPVQARQVGERIGRALKRQQRWGDTPLDFAKTVSMGVATWDGGERPDELAARADAAMEAAKRGGGNQLVHSRSRREHTEPRGRQLDLLSRPASCG